MSFDGQSPGKGNGRRLASYHRYTWHRRRRRSIRLPRSRPVTRLGAGRWAGGRPAGHVTEHAAPKVRCLCSRSLRLIAALDVPDRSRFPAALGPLTRQRLAADQSSTFAFACSYSCCESVSRSWRSTSFADDAPRSIRRHCGSPGSIIKSEAHRPGLPHPRRVIGAPVLVRVHEGPA